jgi:hypothetical protein
VVEEGALAPVSKPPCPSVELVETTVPRSPPIARSTRGVVAVGGWLRYPSPAAFWMRWSEVLLVGTVERLLERFSARLLEKVPFSGLAVGDL